MEKRRKFRIGDEMLSGSVSFGHSATAACSCGRISFFSQIGEQMLTQFRLWIGRYSLLSAKLLTGIRDEREVRTGCYVFLPPGNPSTEPKFMLEIQFPYFECFAWKLRFFSLSFFPFVFVFIALLRFYTWNKMRGGLGRWESTCWRAFDLSNARRVFSSRAFIHWMITIILTFLRILEKEKIPLLWSTFNNSGVNNFVAVCEENVQITTFGNKYTFTYTSRLLINLGGSIYFSCIF